MQARRHFGGGGERGEGEGGGGGGSGHEVYDDEFLDDEPEMVDVVGLELKSTSSSSSSSPSRPGDDVIANNDVIINDDDDRRTDSEEDEEEEERSSLSNARLDTVDIATDDVAPFLHPLPPPAPPPSFTIASLLEDTKVTRGRRPNSKYPRLQAHRSIAGANPGKLRPLYAVCTQPVGFQVERLSSPPPDGRQQTIERPEEQTTMT